MMRTFYLDGNNPTKRILHCNQLENISIQTLNDAESSQQEIDKQVEQDTILTRDLKSIEPLNSLKNISCSI